MMPGRGTCGALVWVLEGGLVGRVASVMAGGSGEGWEQVRWQGA